MTPAEVAWGVASFQATRMKGNTLRLFVYLLGRAMASDSLLVKVGRKRAMLGLHMWRSAFESARGDLSSHLPVSTPTRGRPREYNLREIWCAELRRRGLLPDHLIHLAGGLQPSHVSFLWASVGGPESSHVQNSGGLVPGHVSFPQGGPESSHVQNSGGLVPGHVSFPQGGPESSHVQNSGGLVPGHVEANGNRNGQHDQIRSDQIDRLDRSDRAFSVMEIERARSELRKLRYQNGHPVHPSDAACTAALAAAGNVAQLEAIMPGIIKRINENPDARRPKSPRFLGKWSAKVISTELSENAGQLNGEFHNEPKPKPESAAAKRMRERAENAKPVRL